MHPANGRDKLIRLVLAVVVVVTAVVLTEAQGLASGESSGQRDAPEPVFTKQPLFSIPFYVKPDAPPPREVLLYVSGDRGASWSLYQRRPGSASKFDFQAGDDGEFWFVLRTTEYPNSPTAGTRAEKIVVVDTQTPQLELEVSQVDGDHLEARWSAKDPHLDTGSLRVEYRPGSESPWQVVLLDTAARTNSQDREEGSVRWPVDVAAGEVTVRAQISDRAKNVATSQRQLVLGGPGRSADRPIRDSRPEAADDESAAASAPPIKSQPTDSDHASDIPWPTSASEPAPAASDAGDRRWQGHGPDEGSSESQTAGRAEPVPPAGTKGPSHFRTSSLPTQDADRPRQGIDTVPLEPSTTNATTSRPQMSRSLRFYLDYDVIDVGPSGVGRVELWITDDDGARWTAYGTDEDKQTPALVQVERDAVYGFRLLVHNAEGLASRPPQPGEPPDLRVAVDTTPPLAKLQSAQYGQGNRHGHLEFSWNATDAWLGDGPVTLLFSEHPDGPWSIIAAGLPNTGTYAWRTEQRLPRQIYVRLEVQDEAGNLASDQLPQPVSTDARYPSGKIHSVRPAK